MNALDSRFLELTSCFPPLALRISEADEARRIAVPEEGGAQQQQRHITVD